MKLNSRKLIFKSLTHYRKSAFNQAVIIMVLTAVVTGSLLTGYSVRQSLRDSAGKRLGNTGFLISSGLRYFKPELDSKLTAITEIKTASLLETEGSVEKFGNGNRIENIKIYGIRHTFFTLNNVQGKFIDNVDAAINEHLARRLNLSVGDEIIVTHRQISDLPSSSPFAPSAGNIASHVFKIKYIFTEEEAGNFSIEIKQTTPDNIFVNISELSRTGKANRILIEKDNSFSTGEILEKLKSILVPSDLGLKVRQSERTGFNEILTGRIFFDSTLVEEIKSVIPGASPVITYLVNSTEKESRLNPYSFASGVERFIYPEVPEGNRILINKWLASDIGAKKGDTLTLTWYDPDRISDFKESQGRFIVHDIVEITGKWNDPELMPEFPGISGRQSCSRWDAGVPLKTELIRKKDEEYWNVYKGTPKIFLNYATGKKIWASNFGSATAIRVPPDISKDEILNALTGSIEPVKCGFAIRNIRNDMINAANQSVDFSGLFIGLGFFIIASCFILLIMAVNSFLDSRRSQIFSFFALGFSNRKIKKLLLAENLIISLAGCLTGVFAGIFFNEIVVWALNGVWRGAVQTDTIKAVTGLVPSLAGFLAAFLTSITLQFIRIRKFLKEMQMGESREFKVINVKPGLIKIISTLFITAGIVLLLADYAILKEPLLSVSYSAGGLLFAGLILFWFFIIIRKEAPLHKTVNSELAVSRSYYSFYPARAVMPVLLISAGLFAVIITGVNRLKVNESSLSPRGGTGGFLLWAETTVPVKENLNTKEGKKAHGLSYFPAETIFFLQAKRLQGDDASCLNLHHVTSPPLLGIDPSTLREQKAFSFSTLLKEADPSDPWEILNRTPGENIIYGYADQTVLQWGLKMRVGDTLIYNAENGEKLYIIIAGGLKSSVFQGYVITGEKSFSRFFPSVSGYSVFLAGGNPELSEDYRKILSARFNSYGINIMSTRERLEKFFEVTNTYLSVFMVLGGLGMVLGVIGLAFVLRQNYNFRRREFALMLATGFMVKKIRKILLKEQITILIAGVITGSLSALVSTLPSVEKSTDIPLVSILTIIVAIIFTGITALLFAIRSVDKNYLISALRKE
ncbi:MAG: FtsX-like permease family protein [Bacteroidales bacterium]